MTNEPKISVMVPVYNVEDYLSRCLDSIISQPFDDIEIICVNDASTDGSLAILNRYAERDGRLRIIDKPENEGLMMARRSAIDIARGEYFMFCDSDDYLAPDALRILYDKACASEVYITAGQIFMADSTGRTYLRSRSSIAGSHGMEYLKAILNWTTCSLCGSLFKRDLFVDKPYRTFMHQSFSEDRLLLTQILLTCNPSVITIDRPAYYYWVNNSSITHRTLTPDKLNEQLRALFECHRMVAEAAIKSIAVDNDGFISRYIATYLEQGNWSKFIRNFSPQASEMMQFKAIADSAGHKLALHVWALQYVPGYRRLASAGRKAIRKLQGKI